jgi:hypothetical protein
MCKVEVGKYVQTIREDSGIWGMEFKLNIRAKSEVHLGGFGVKTSWEVVYVGGFTRKCNRL